MRIKPLLCLILCCLVNISCHRQQKAYESERLVNKLDAELSGIISSLTQNNVSKAEFIDNVEIFDKKLFRASVFLTNEVQGVTYYEGFRMAFACEYSKFAAEFAVFRSHSGYTNTLVLKRMWEVKKMLIGYYDIVKIRWPNDVRRALLEYSQKEVHLDI